LALRAPMTRTVIGALVEVCAGSREMNVATTRTKTARNLARTVGCLLLDT
jgi:hypothetical protein